MATTGPTPDEIVLGGFDTADSHHSMHAFTWDPGGGLHFQEGIFQFSQVESPYGPVRKHDAGIFRFEPRTGQVRASSRHYPFYNPWGHYVDRWGQDFVADASTAANYFGTAFSGDPDYPDKHGQLEDVPQDAVAAHLRLRVGLQPQLS